MSIHEAVATTIDGEIRSLEMYAGNVLLVVNVASLCGYTPQYRALEELHRTYSPRGFRVLAFPSNDFGAQEPGNEQEIRIFCTARYAVTFEMFAKVHAKGDSIHPVFAALTSSPRGRGDVRWNFTKFLVSRSGEVLSRFEPNIDPMADEVRQAVDAALADS